LTPGDVLGVIPFTLGVLPSVLPTVGTLLGATLSSTRQVGP
jgi:hypothetical protein